MTAILWRDGLYPGRCDTPCHNGDRFSRCRCLCRGRYHGAGSKAEELLRRDVEAGVWDGAGRLGISVLIRQPLPMVV